MEEELKEEINRLGIYNLHGRTHGVFGKQHGGTGIDRWTAIYHVIRIAFSLSRGIKLRSTHCINA